MWWVLGFLGGALLLVVALTVYEAAKLKRSGEEPWKREDEGGDYTGWG